LLLSGRDVCYHVGMSHTAFMSAIRQNPEEDAARLVFADYLDEQGGPAHAARAEFIRVQVELARLPETDPNRPALEDRENELLRAHEAAWLGELPKAVTNWKFERGFLTELEGGPSAFELAGTRTALKHHPVTRVRITGSAQKPGTYERLAKAPWLARVRELELDNVSLDPDGAGPLLVSPHLAHVSALKLHRVSAAQNLGTVLRKSPVLGTLKRLELVNWNGHGGRLASALEPSGVEDLRFTNAAIDLGALLTGTLADRLTRLEVNGLTTTQWTDLLPRTRTPALTHLGVRVLSSGSITELLAAPACARVVGLDLNESRVTAKAVREIARSAFWKRCHEFRLIRGKCSPETMKRLVGRAGPPELRVLKLGETGLRDAGVRHLCDAPWADALTDLDIMRNRLTDAACETIRASGRLRNVRHLDVRTNGPKLASNIKERITDAGLEALAQAPGLARVRVLNCHSLPVGTGGAVALLSGPHWRLADLDIGGTDITAETIRELARCPNLARLTRLNLSFVNGLTDDDLMPLAESEYLSPVCEVGAIYYRFSAKCRDAMRARLGRRFKS
jgi:uncharacterized protein (TIGR02996 family)